MLDYFSWREDIDEVIEQQKELVDIVVKLTLIAVIKG